MNNGARRQTRASERVSDSRMLKNATVRENVLRLSETNVVLLMTFFMQVHTSACERSHACTHTTCYI